MALLPGLGLGQNVENCCLLLVPGDSWPRCELELQTSWWILRIRIEAIGNIKNWNNGELGEGICMCRYLSAFLTPSPPSTPVRTKILELEDLGQRKVEAFTGSLLFPS